MLTTVETRISDTPAFAQSFKVYPPGSGIMTLAGIPMGGG